MVLTDYSGRPIEEGLYWHQGGGLVYFYKDEKGVMKIDREDLFLKQIDNEEDNQDPDRPNQHKISSVEANHCTRVSPKSTQRHLKQLEKNAAWVRKRLASQLESQAAEAQETS